MVSAARSDPIRSALRALESTSRRPGPSIAHSGCRQRATPAAEMSTEIGECMALLMPGATNIRVFSMGPSRFNFRSRTSNKIQLRPCHADCEPPTHTLRMPGLPTRSWSISFPQRGPHKISECRSMLSGSWPKSVEIADISPNPGQGWPHFSRCSSNSDRTRPHVCRIDRILCLVRPHLGRSSAN